MEENSRTKILVVDDEKEMRELLFDFLSSEGFAVTTANDGVEAFEIFKKENFPIVITDIRMAKMDGITLLKKIKGYSPLTTVIIITAYPSTESVKEAIFAGAYDYITKPFDLDTIKIVVQRAAERQYLIEEAKQKEFYKDLSIRDGLSGLFNYRYFREVLEREIEKSKRYGHPFSLIMLDIDDFKKYNDRYGHLEGDRVLKKMASFILTQVRKIDMVFRYGGEEIFILLPELPKSRGIVVAKRLKKAIKEELPITVSVGISGFPEDGEDVETLVKKADFRMYDDKRNSNDNG
ncbi:MAG: diguanylate cyclase [Candidatus Aminicenantia bacterium]